MPRVIACAEEAARCELEEYVAALRETGFEPADEASLEHAAGWLRRLGNNPAFLGDIMLKRLAERHRDDPEQSAYGPQVIMLSRPTGEFFLRANIWPSRDEHMFRASGGDTFVYGVPTITTSIS